MTGMSKYADGLFLNLLIAAMMLCGRRTFRVLFDSSLALLFVVKRTDRLLNELNPSASQRCGVDGNVCRLHLARFAIGGDGGVCKVL
mmetsp:Transcript_17108/g.37093  ORF Transcript_17108/g.37093 Transcript_17108/m.37093 type:complete len:87 (+) Transcript_17108:1250-1510(+)